MNSKLVYKNLPIENDIKLKSAIRENIEAILLAILLALFIRTFIVQAFKIPSGSMIKTLLVGDHILVNKFSYGVKLGFTGQTIIPISNPKRGDIVVFRFPENPKLDFIKRVVATQGDKVEIKNKDVFINDQPVKNKHAIFTDKFRRNVPLRDNLGPIIVPENSIFVMGDNRDNSNDSRFWGFVNLNLVKGKAFIVYWSWGNDGIRWNRIAHLLK